MGFAAAHTTTLRLIPNIVVLPYRNPFVVAKSGATLDLLSDGRFTLAVGVGLSETGIRGARCGLRRTRGSVRGGAGGDPRIWTTDDFSYEGRHFTAKGITAHPRPVSRPHPPIWIGGNTAAARQRVTKYGDGWCPFPAPAVSPRPHAPRRWTRRPGRRDRRPAPPIRRRGPGSVRHRRQLHQRRRRQPGR